MVSIASFDAFGNAGGCAWDRSTSCASLPLSQSPSAALQRQRAARDLAALLMRVVQRPQVAAYEALRWRRLDWQLSGRCSVSASAASSPPHPLQAQRQRQKCKKAAQELRRQLRLCHETFHAMGDAGERAILGAQAFGTKHNNLGRILRCRKTQASVANDGVSQEVPHFNETAFQFTKQAVTNGAMSSSSSTASISANSRGADGKGNIDAQKPIEDDALWEELNLIVTNLGQERPNWAQRLDSIMRRLNVPCPICRQDRDANKGGIPAAEIHAVIPSDNSFADLSGDRSAVLEAKKKKVTGLMNSDSYVLRDSSFGTAGHHDSFEKSSAPNGARKRFEQALETCAKEDVIFAGSPGTVACAVAAPSRAEGRTTRVGKNDLVQPANQSVERLASPVVPPPAREVAAPHVVRGDASNDYSSAWPRTRPPGRSPQARRVPSVRISLLAECGVPVGDRSSTHDVTGAASASRANACGRDGRVVSAGSQMGSPDVAAELRPSALVDAGGFQTTVTCTSDDEDYNEASDSDASLQRMRICGDDGRDQVVSLTLAHSRAPVHVGAASSSRTAVLKVPALGLNKEHQSEIVTSAPNEDHSSGVAPSPTFSDSTATPPTPGVPVEALAVPPVALRSSSIATIATTAKCNAATALKVGGLANSGGSSAKIMRQSSATLYTPRLIGAQNRGGSASIGGTTKGGTALGADFCAKPHSEPLSHEGLSRSRSFNATNASAVRPNLGPFGIQGVVPPLQAAACATGAAYTPRHKSNTDLRSGMIGPLRGTQAPCLGVGLLAMVAAASSCNSSGDGHNKAYRNSTDDGSGSARSRPPKRMVSGSILQKQSGGSGSPTPHQAAGNVTRGTVGLFKPVSTSVSPGRCSQQAHHNQPTFVAASGGEIQRRSGGMASAAVAVMGQAPATATATTSVLAAGCASTMVGSVPGTPAAAGPRVAASAVRTALNPSIHLWSPRSPRPPYLGRQGVADAKHATGSTATAHAIPATSANNARGPPAQQGSVSSACRREVSAEPAQIGRSASATLSVSPRSYGAAVVASGVGAHHTVGGPSAAMAKVDRNNTCSKIDSKSDRWIV